MVNAKGFEVDENGFILSELGQTAYLYVVPDVEFEKNGLYWASVSVNETDRAFCGNKSRFYNLYKSTDVRDCAYMATKFVMEYNGDRKILKGYKLRSKGFMWGDQFDMPVHKFEARKGKVAIREKFVKQAFAAKVKTAKETNINKEFVEKAVSALLGPKVEVKVRIKIKDIVVANTEFYRTAEDVTKYVQDLVNYNFK